MIFDSFKKINKYVIYFDIEYEITYSVKHFQINYIDLCLTQPYNNAFHEMILKKIRNMLNINSSSIYINKILKKSNTKFTNYISNIFVLECELIYSSSLKKDALLRNMKRKSGISCDFTSKWKKLFDNKIKIYRVYKNLCNIDIQELNV